MSGTPWATNRRVPYTDWQILLPQWQALQHTPSVVQEKDTYTNYYQYVSYQLSVRRATKLSPECYTKSNLEKFISLIGRTFTSCTHYLLGLTTLIRTTCWCVSYVTFQPRYLPQSIKTSSHFNACLTTLAFQKIVNGVTSLYIINRIAVPLKECGVLSGVGTSNSSLRGHCMSTRNFIRYCTSRDDCAVGEQYCS